MADANFAGMDAAHGGAGAANTASETTALASKSILEKISDKLGANTDSADDNADQIFL